MKKIIILGLLFIFFGFLLIKCAFSQTGYINTGVIKGTVTEKDTETPVEYATIALFGENSNEVISGTVTDASGAYELNNIADGTYMLVADFIGYDKQDVNAIKISSENNTAVLNIFLKRSVNEIEEVEILAEKNTVDYKIDRKIINVGKNISASGGTAVDALANVPSVQTDIEGNVTVRGSSNFTVLIDGKPTVLDASDALQQIPASLIESIEIITNPSAKYDPDGTAGIINVITKKTEAKGLTGQINASVGTGISYDGNIYLKYNTPKFSVFGNIDYGERVHEMNGNHERYTYTDDITETLLTDVEGAGIMGRYGASLGIDYYLTKNNTFSLTGRYHNMNMDRSESSLNSYLSSSDADWDYYLSEDINVMKPEMYSISLTDIQKFSKKGHELSTSFFINKSNMIKNEAYIQYASDPDRLKGDLLEDGTLITENEDENYKLDIDYTLPLGKNGKAEAGINWRQTTTGSDFSSQYLYPDESTVSDEDHTNFMRQIFAGYGTYSDKIGNFGYKLGLRGEYTNRILEQKTLNEDYVYEHFDLYPSAYLTYNFKNDDQIQLNYSKRLNRPMEFFLNPYVVFSDGFSVMKGNPALEPEYAHVAELNFIKKFKNSFVSLETFFRKTNNKITHTGTLDDEGVLVMSFDNMDSDQSAGAELMLNLQLFNKWTINLNGSLYSYEVEGEYDDEYVEKESNNWDIKAMTMLRLGKSTSLQFTAMYRSPSVTLEGDRDAMFFAGAAVKQDLFKKRLSLSLNIQDIFDTGHMEHTIETESYKIHSEMYRQAPFINFQLTYKINNLKNVNESGGSDTGGYEMYMQ